MKFLNQLLILGQTWTGSLAILGMVLVLLILRRFLPAVQRTLPRLCPNVMKTALERITDDRAGRKLMVGLWAAELLRLRARVCQVRSWARARLDG